MVVLLVEQDLYEFQLVVGAFVLEDVAQQPPRQASSADERVIPTACVLEGHFQIATSPAAVDFGVVLHGTDYTSPSCERRRKPSRTGRTLDKTDKLVAEAHFGKVEERFVPCPDPASIRCSSPSPRDGMLLLTRS